ncbi:hypothetical protein H6F77_21820 [Microcoleus sp. FACHB-831]|jgi:hypothetical protein|uniref:HpsJ-like protein, cyanoexosortase A-associated n=1 Tax=Microcoleus sp. FACHB-831 TaxID=2692827 RepID=UPI001689CBF0|nr:HpsJ family protein [Microcoleus sp. FACHB-831]MBD1923688.1 hypothetical protein [Microcoleus sp. FACHB-831]
MSQFEGSKGRYIHTLRWVGYGLLLFSLVDTIDSLVPPDFMNPAWELQTVGKLVERVVVPLLGFALVFFAEDYDRTGVEEAGLKWLSWLSLLLGLLFFLMVPLGISGTLRIDNQNNSQISAQLQQQVSQLQQIETQVNQGTPENIQTIAIELNRIGIPVDSQKPDQLKSEILSRIATAKQELPTKAEEARSNQRFALLKNSVKWNLGALIGSVLFFTIWRTSRWARRL